MTHCNAIVIGASAGGVSSLTQLVRELPSDLEAAIAVALHVPAESTSALPAILTRERTLKAEHPKDGEPLRHGLIYVAPPGRHLLVKRRTVRVVNGPNENGHRPAVDPLFRTAARAHGRRTMGVVLSGSLDDGTAGLAVVKAHGGAVLVQDPADALFQGMPQSAIDNVDVDFTGNPAALAQELVRRTMQLDLQPDHPEPDEDCPEELDVVEMDAGTPDPEHWAANPSPFSCPECHGILFERKDGTITRYRCRTGHAYSPDALVAAQTQGVETAMWIALRALEENSALLHRLAQRAADRRQSRAAQRFLSQAHGVEIRARVIRDALQSGGGSAVA
jgi:two-component system, chemotaxis family, protein-glutamate methylesterase/glutaminase